MFFISASDRHKYSVVSKKAPSFLSFLGEYYVVYQPKTQGAKVGAYISTIYHWIQGRIELEIYTQTEMYSNDTLDILLHRLPTLFSV